MQAVSTTRSESVNINLYQALHQTRCNLLRQTGWIRLDRKLASRRESITCIKCIRMSVYTRRLGSILMTYKATVSPNKYLTIQLSSSGLIIHQTLKHIEILIGLAVFRRVHQHGLYSLPYGNYFQNSILIVINHRGHKLYIVSNQLYDVPTSLYS